MKMHVFCIVFIYLAGTVGCLPRKSIHRQQHQDRKEWKRTVKHSKQQQQQQQYKPQLEDLYFNELKVKRSRGPSLLNSNDLRNYENGGISPSSSSDFFGIQDDDSVRLMDYTDRASPVGHAENFVDPFSDMVEEKDVQQFAYNQNQEGGKGEVSRISLQDQMPPHQRQILNSPTSHDTSPQIQNHNRHTLANEQKLVLENALADHHTKHNEKNIIQASVRATDKDTETQQAKARIMAYTAKHKDDNEKNKKNSSNPFSYLTLPDTQSVEITQKNYKSKQREDKESKESDNKDTSDIKINQHQKEEEEASLKGQKSSNKTQEHLLKDEEEPAPSPSKAFASSPTNITISTPLEDTPPDSNAEPVPTEVVEVKEAPDGNSESSELGSDIKNAADEMSFIVSSAMPSPANTTGLGKLLLFISFAYLLLFIFIDRHGYIFY